VQKTRAALLFNRYPSLKQAYDLAIKLSDIFRLSPCKEAAFKRLALWYNTVEDSGLDNAKIKAFRAAARGVRDINFFLFRLSNIYA
jgi:hypothetical protein